MLVVGTALTLALFVVVGLRSLSVAAWGAAAFTAPLSGLRVSSLALSDVALIVAVSLTLLSLVARRRPDAAAFPAGPPALDPSPSGAWSRRSMPPTPRQVWPA